MRHNTGRNDNKKICSCGEDMSKTNGNGVKNINYLVNSGNSFVNIHTQSKAAATQTQHAANRNSTNPSVNATGGSATGGSASSF